MTVTSNAFDFSVRIAAGGLLHDGKIMSRCGKIGILLSSLFLFLHAVNG